VVIFGSISGARQLLRRFLAGGATVTLVVDGPLPPHADRVSTVRYVTRPSADDTAGILRLIGPAWLVVGRDPRSGPAWTLRRKDRDRHPDAGRECHDSSHRAPSALSVSAFSFDGAGGGWGV